MWKNNREKSAVVIEIDNEEITGDAGIVHEKCIQPVDRVLGTVCLEGDFVNQSVNKLDVYLWCKLMVGGQGCWNNIGMLTDRCFNFFIDTKDVFRKGNYCVRMLLENGEHRYVKDRGLVHRLNYNDAVAYVTYLNRIYKRAIIENNPMCYSSETDTYGQYNDLVKQLGIKEEYITCVSAECIRYNDNIARKYNECERYYTPIIYLLVDGRPLALEGVVPFITNPLDIDRYVNNWCLSGYIIEDYDVEVVENDNDFILLLAGVFGNDELPIVNCLFTKNKELVQGVIIQDMSLLGIPRNFCEGMQVDYDFV